MSKDSADNIEHSSAEVVSISDNAKATHLRDIYIKSGTEESLLCNVKGMVCIDKTRLVIADSDEEPGSFFAYNKEDTGKSMFRVKLYDTKRNQIVSEVKVPGEFKGMAKINESQVVVSPHGHKLLLLKVGSTLIADRCLSFNFTYDNPVTAVSCCDEHLDVCRRTIISRFNIKDKVTERRVAMSRGKYGDMGTYVFFSNAVYKDRDKTLMYTIEGLDDRDRHSGKYVPKYGNGDRTLKHGMGNMENVRVPGDPKSVMIDDEGELCFVITDNQRISSHACCIFHCIYVLRAGTTDGRVILSEEDGLRHVSAVSYCSKTRELFVAMEESNYVKVYQLSGVP